jgi:hypothetical protein
MRGSQAIVAILCLTSHFAPRTTQTRQSHNTNTQTSKLDIAVIFMIIWRGSRPRDSAWRWHAGAGVCSDGVGRFATTAALREAAPTVKPAGGAQVSCPATPLPRLRRVSLSLEIGGCRHVSALPDCKSSREEVRPADRRYAALRKSPASTPHRHRKDRRSPALALHAEISKCRKPVSPRHVQTAPSPMPWKSEAVPSRGCLRALSCRSA